MSPQSLKNRLILPPKEKSKFSIWTCGTTRAQAQSDLEIDGFYTSKSQYVDDRFNAGQYASNRSVTNTAVKEKRSYSRYHYSRADEWEASKNLRHLLSKNVNFLSPSESMKHNREVPMSIGNNSSISARTNDYKFGQRSSVKTPTDMSRRMTAISKRELDQRSISDHKQ